MSNSTEPRGGATDHLDDIDGIVGCTEIWERMNAVRNTPAETQEGRQ